MVCAESMTINQSQGDMARYGWRYQIKPWVEAGYRVIAIDNLGYGQTDRPNDVEQYSTKSLSNDLAALLDHLGLSKAVRLSQPRSDLFFA